MNKRIFVQDIVNENMEVDDLFIVTKKVMLSTKNNTKYISVELRDRTGTIEGKIWDRADEITPLFDKNDVVSVKGRMKIYLDKPQLNINEIRRVEEGISFDVLRAFFPEGGDGIESLKNEYFQLVEDIEDQYLGSLFSSLAERDDLLERFFFLPASINVHHVYIGGLLEHTVSVAKMGSAVSKIIGADRDIIVAGALLHDIGKVEEIEVKGGFKHSDRGRLMGHITLGIIILEELIRGIEDFPPSMADMLSHIIVSHHGIEEWGSPKRPMSIEALVVHYLDNLDARVMGAKEYMKENMVDEKWTEYHRVYETRFYKIPER
ncbi:MAG: HD domain-containing protein [Syntrophorhabdaceae bacterium]|nr:HD domain-containing protein [Syntrophorhabdaceae bacterium]